MPERGSRQKYHPPVTCLVLINRTAAKSPSDTVQKVTV